MKNSKMRFRNYGSSCQAVIETADDVVKVAKLDAAHWAITGIDKSSLVCDGDFLDFIDSDVDGRIRTDEVRKNLNWLLKVLKSPKRIIDATDEVNTAMLNTDDEEGAILEGTVKRILSSLGLPEGSCVTLERIADEKKIISDSLHNGDGVIPPETLKDEKLASFANDVMKFAGGKLDLSGLMGIDLAAVEKFEEMMKVHVSLADELSTDKKTILPFGDDTKKLYASFSEVKDSVDGFFTACGTAAFTGKDLYFPCEVSDKDKVNDFLEKSPISMPSSDFVLRTDKNVNPLWKKRLASFVDDAEAVAKLDFSKKLSLSDWQKLSASLAPCGKWLGKVNADPIAEMDASVVKKQMSDDLCGKLKALIKEDADCKTFIENVIKVKKLAVLKKYMLSFLNNYVSTSMLFTSCGKSMLQAGCLIMDGRRFTLCTFIKDVEEHKKIAKLSDICIIYVEVEMGDENNKTKRNLAVAVTSGNIRDVFIGKYGIFASDDNTIWDAKVIDLIEQPVSIPEAIKMPFHKFSALLQKQTDKFFGTKSKTFENNAVKDFQTISNTPFQNPNQAKTQTPAFSGAMVLMGGGVGIAAIGSAFAFMAKTLQGISVWLVLAVFLGILFIFGAPIVISSLIKLFHRNLALFLEANAVAMNKKIFLTLKLGNVFTYTPRLPKKKMVSYVENVVDSDENERIKHRKALLVVFLFMIFAALCIVIYVFFPEQIMLSFERVKTFFSR